MIREVWAIGNIKKNYIKVIQKLSFSQFNVFVRVLQVVRSNYRQYTTSQYYLLLTERSFCDQFIEQLFYGTYKTRFTSQLLASLLRGVMFSMRR